MKGLTGQTISHYRIVEKLGEGGMGVVYRAEDTKLGRTVALKFLLPHVVSDESTRQRFLREAQAAAALSHSNICTVYEIDDPGGQTFIAMEFVDGSSIADKLRERPLPLDEAFDIAIQTASGLHQAHERGVIHRDIKSGNILLTKSGQVKITDFGLAHLTERSRLTKSSSTLGTPAYMSPEQALGKTADRRTDIWSLGVMLYEMLTGRLPFDGDYEQAIVYSIINEDPEPPTALRTGLPIETDRLIAKALAKHPDERYQHMDDLLVDVRVLRNRPVSRSTTVSPPMALRRLPWWRNKAFFAAAAAGVAALAGFILGRGTSSNSVNPPGAVAPAASVALEMTASPELALDKPTDYGFDIPLLDISADGNSIVFVGTAEGTTQLYLRRLDRFEAESIAGTQGAIHPFFSPDGRSVGYLTHNQVRVVPLEGGAPVVLCDATWPIRAKWLDDGPVYFNNGMGQGIWRVSSAGGDCASVTPANQPTYVYHEVLPGAKFVLATIRRSASHDNAEIRAVPLAGGEATTVITNGYDPRFVSPGFLLFGRGGDLFAVRFDSATLAIRGPPKRVASGVRMNSMFPWVHAAASSSGSLAYVPGGDVAVGRLAWVDRQGLTEFLPLREGVFNEFDVAPDGRIAVHVCGSRDYVQIYEPGKGETLRLEAPGSVGFPRWSRRGDRIAVSNWTSFEGDWNAAVYNVNSTLEPTVVHRENAFMQPASWTADDSRIAIRTIRGVSLYSVSDPAAEPIDIAANWDADIATQGPWIAFSRRGIVVRPLHGEQVYQVSPEIGFETRWCRTCDQLFYRRANQIFAANVRFSPEFQWEQPRPAFEIPDFVDTWGVSYAPSPGGERVLVVKRTGEFPRDRIRVVQNWLAAFDADEPSR